MPRETQPARRIRSPARSSTPSASATRSPAISSRRSFTSGFNEDLSRRIVWDGVFPAHRRAADADQFSLRAARRRGHALRARQRAGRVVGHVRGQGPRRARPRVCSIAARRRTRVRRSSRRSDRRSSGACACRPVLIGTDATHDIPLPDNVRRYYYPGTTHGGGRGGFQRRRGARRAGRLRVARQSESRSGHDARTDAGAHRVGRRRARRRPPAAIRGSTAANSCPRRKAAVGFPDIPGLVFTNSPVNPVLDYDFGPGFHANDLSGVISTAPAADRAGHSRRTSRR